MDEASIETARRTLGEIVDKARIAGEHTRITRQGKAAATVSPVGWHDAAAEAFTVISLMLEDKDNGAEWESGMTKLSECLTRAGLPRYAPPRVHEDPEEQGR